MLCKMVSSRAVHNKMHRARRYSRKWGCYKPSMSRRSMALTDFNKGLCEGFFYTPGSMGIESTFIVWYVMQKYHS